MSEKATLYELTGELLQLKEMASDPEIDEQVLADTMEGVEGEFEAKMQGYAMVIRELEAECTVLSAKESALKEEQDRIKAYRTTKENYIKRMKKRMSEAMVATDKLKFETDYFKFRYGHWKSSVIADVEKDDINPDNIPSEYLRTKYELDKDKIAKAIEAGAKISFAHLEKNEGVTFK